ncbi:MAG: ferritin-like domain-containing protein [Vicinamibacteria bacterium]
MLTSSTAAAVFDQRESPDARARFARAQLRFLLQLAYSGELAATRAYLGHHHSLRDRTERAELAKIIRDEIRHRHCLLDQLAELGARPDPWRERKMERVGRSIAAFCQVGGWFFPMWGAGRLEAQNVREYEVAARLALVAEVRDFVEPFLEMAEVEWDHERYFRGKAASHPLWRVMPAWPALSPRESIRASFRAFEASPDRPIAVVRAPWLVR